MNAPARRHAVVTGAAGGLGLAVTRHLAAAGWTVTAVDLRGEALQRSVDGLPDVQTDVADLGSPDAPGDVVRRAWEFAPVDGLVNAAGIYPAVPFDTLGTAVWDRVQNVNVRAAVFATQALAELARGRGVRPAVVNLTSGAARRARPGAAAYNVSKAALVMATQALAVELAAQGIRVNAVSPGFFGVGSEVNPVTEEYAAAVSATLLPGPADPVHVGHAVEFLLSPAAGWTTGSVLNVDGGATAGTNALPVHWPGPTRWQLGETR
ncbi:SDR family NAD(P)-dependent oxidoreductase [Kineococcus rhizosphaerae]|uniref:NAD(P)-dependent dehydrogenase (Short-subunit alcohol dehydrogenase family) n=1 Tax=Kineococcus rhizosphaerae TaxID=559628 RepID=A0A2T0R1C5_9ACTN|nr:SDR family oxidoreductase [Kineococcus rhizosphaerae]PRY13070.1 NAD(P)-dependent dehydrogenase (short-subunit alcohol dehydrogenase family) [Kineococcus rhizosphaerae]